MRFSQLSNKRRGQAPGPRHAYRARFGRSGDSLYGDFAQYILKEILGYNTVLDGDDYTAAEHEPIANGSVEFALGQFSASKRQLIAPFELKGANTDLDSIMPGRYKTPVRQAWTTRPMLPARNRYSSATMSSLGCYAFGYGRQRYESWDLSRLSDPHELARLHLLLAANNLFSGDTVLCSSKRTRRRGHYRELYADYRSFGSGLFRRLAIRTGWRQAKTPFAMRKKYRSYVVCSIC